MHPIDEIMEERCPNLMKNKILWSFWVPYIMILVMRVGVSILRVFSQGDGGPPGASKLRGRPSVICS